jgi:hypothetical protein
MRLSVGRLLFLPLLLGLAAPLAAQRPIQVQGIKNLAFGLLLAGTPGSVPRTDPVRAGQINVTAQPKSPIIIQISLPASMSGPAGATLPLAFGANDAGYSSLGSIASQVAFDPRNSAVVLTNTSNGRGTIYLGGTASPAFNQQPGNYTGVITITVAYP